MPEEFPFMEHADQTLWHGFQVVSCNIPLNRAGVYGLQNIIKPNKWYVGTGVDIAKRVPQHLTAKGTYKIDRALRKYGAQGFRAMALFYLQEGEDIDFLLLVELELIRAYDSIRNGYNIVEYDPKATLRYGEAHAETVRRAHARPETHARVLAANRDITSRPEVRAKLSKSVLEAYSNGTVQEAISKKVTASWQDPDIRARHLAARATPEFKATVVATLQGPEATAKRLEKFRSPEHRAAVGQWLHTPEVQAKRTDALRNPEVQQRKSTKQRSTFADPAYKVAHGARSREIMSRPAIKVKHAASIKASWDIRREKYGPSGRPPKPDGP
jgi:group I intron endonuclease